MSKVIQIANLSEKNNRFSNPQTGRVYSINGVSPTINTCQGGQREPKIVIGVKYEKPCNSNREYS